MSAYRIVTRRDGRDVWQELQRFTASWEAAAEFYAITGVVASALDDGVAVQARSLSTMRDIRVEVTQ